MLPYEPFVGIWVKAEPRHITTFIDNWEKFNEPQAFCVYDLPPMLPYSGLIFLHAIGQNRIMAWAKYVGYDNVKGWYEHDTRANDSVWLSERERIWQSFTPRRLHTHDKDDFDRFWMAQMGVRGLFIMEAITRVTERVGWTESMEILQVHRPLGFSYRYLTASQVEQFMRLIGTPIKLTVEGIHNPKVIITPLPRGSLRGYLHARGIEPDINGNKMLLSKRVSAPSASRHKLFDLSAPLQYIQMG